MNTSFPSYHITSPAPEEFFFQMQYFVLIFIADRGERREREETFLFISLQLPPAPWIISETQVTSCHAETYSDVFRPPLLLSDASHQQQIKLLIFYRKLFAVMRVWDISKYSKQSKTSLNISRGRERTNRTKCCSRYWQSRPSRPWLSVYFV